MDLFDLDDNFSSELDVMLESSEQKRESFNLAKESRRTINTYALIPMDQDILKGYWKTLKKKWGCNGSFKLNGFSVEYMIRQGLLINLLVGMLKNLYFISLKIVSTTLLNFLRRKELMKMILK